MQGHAPGLPLEARGIVEEEEALLKRVLTSIRKAAEDASRRARGSDLRSVDALKQLREEARTESADDLPALLLEMSVRQRLMERPIKQPLPDPLTPYIAHLRVKERGAHKDYLLGRTSFFDVEAGVRIVDWRVAPVAQIFYRYREGDEFEETFPGRVAEGSVDARRIVVISRGSLAQILGDGYTLAQRPDGQWDLLDQRRYALDSGGAGKAVRPGILEIGAGLARRRVALDVTAMLDADQYAAISTPPEKPLLVLGSAGSGKTTVALHRLATIAAREPSTYPLSRMDVVVPEEGLARLSRRLLEPLGASSAQVRTLDAWAYELAHEVFEGQVPRLCTEPPALVSSLKRHPAFYRLIRERFGRIALGRTSLKGLYRKLSQALTDRSFLESVVEASRSEGALPRTAIEDTVAHTMLQLADPIEKELASIVVRSMKQALDGRPIAEGTPDELAGSIDVEDVPILLFLRAWRRGIEAREIAHLVHDEAEDSSLFELFVLGKLLNKMRSVTLAGDEAQQTSSSFAGWNAALDALGVQNASICRLAVSYRCPRPVVELARSILGDQVGGAARSPHEGAPIGSFHFPGEGQAHLFLAGAVRDLARREPDASIAVIAHDQDGARRMHALFSDVPEARLVLHGEFSFEPGIDVSDVDNVKGLEFDYVIVPDATAEAYPDTAGARRRLHVAVTRTSHQLWIVSSRSPSPLLPAREPQERIDGHA